MKTPRLYLCLFAVATLAVSCATMRTGGSFPEVNNLPVHTDQPDVFTMNNGTRVTTPAQWRQRREEMKATLEHYELGHAPPPPGNVAGEDIKGYAVLDGGANYRLVHLKFGPGQKLGFDVAIFTPTNAGPFPTIINPSFSMTPGINFTNGMVALTNEPVPTNSTGKPKLNTNRPVDPEKAAQGYAEALRRGYAVVTYRYTECGEEKTNEGTNWLKSAYYPAYPGYDWGELLGWAWGLSRVVDFVETQPFADTNKIIALGHSRLGKLTMVATAFDERIALGAPAGSSGAGTGAYRFCGPGRGGKEGIEDMTRKFPYYFVPRLKQFTGQMDKLPFDAYWYVALAAPRPWISIEGTDDQNCVPNAVRQTVNAAYPVYEFLGVSADHVGVNYEKHRHALTPEDWTAALDFADQQLRGINHSRRFDQFPADTAPAPYVAPTNTFDVRDFGAFGDGTNLDTDAFQKALDTCAVAGGGEVVVPAGNYLIGSIQLGKQTVLKLEQGSILTGSSNTNDYPMMDIRWEGRWEPGHRALIYAANVDHTGIIGPGQIIGSTNVAAPQNPRGVVILEPISCNDVRWEGFSITQGGNWATHPTYCADVVIKGIKIEGRRDGIDIDSCKNVRIEDCNINTGDDSISLKSGRGLDGARVGIATENVVITNCTLVDRRFACVGIGSEVSGGIRDVWMSHCRMTAHSTAIFIKSRIGRAGTVENIYGDNLDIANGGFLRVNLITSGNKNTVNDPVDGLPGYTLGRNFKFSDIRLTNATVLADVSLLSPEKPLDGFSLVNVTGDCKKAITICNTLHARLHDINVTGYQGAFLTLTNAQGEGLETK